MKLLEGRSKLLTQISGLLALVGSFLFFWHNVVGGVPALLAYIFIGMSGFFRYLGNQASQREAEVVIEKKEAEIALAKSETERELPVLELLTKHLKLAIKREEVNKLRSEARSNNLFSLGRFFLVTSISGPILAAVMYLFIEPLSVDTINALKVLNNNLGGLPDGLQLSVIRDWRILVAGVTFGFLFLAAARGILNQQEKQSDIFLAFAEKINFLERLLSVAEIRLTLNRGNEDAQVKVVEEIIASLLKLDGEELDEKKDEEEQPFLDSKLLSAQKEILELLKNKPVGA